MVGSVVVAVGGWNLSRRSDGLSAENLAKLLNLGDIFFLLRTVKCRTNTQEHQHGEAGNCVAMTWDLMYFFFCHHTDFKAKCLWKIHISPVLKHTNSIFCFMLHTATYWVFRHDVLFLALCQITHLVEGKVIANHCLHNEFAWSYGPSILMTPVENAISYFASEFPIIAQMASSVVIKKKRQRHMANVFIMLFKTAGWPFASCW